MQKLVEEAIKQFNKKNIALEVIKQLPSGKEADVIIVRWGGDLYALKVYRDYTLRSFQNNHDYLAGKYTRQKSERRAMKKRTKFGKSLIQRLWVKREFYLLRKLFDAGANIPEPIEMVRNAILMQYIGNEDTPASLLKDVNLDKKEVVKVFNRIQDNIDIFLKCGIVHSDLSEFIIIYWEGKIYIIDFPQAIDIRNNPNKEKLLKRDKDNILKWYKRVSSS